MGFTTLELPNGNQPLTQTLTQGPSVPVSLNSLIVPRNCGTPPETEGVRMRHQESESTVGSKYSAHDLQQLLDENYNRNKFKHQERNTNPEFN